MLLEKLSPHSSEQKFVHYVSIVGTDVLLLSWMLQVYWGFLPCVRHQVPVPVERLNLIELDPSLLEWSLLHPLLQVLVASPHLQVVHAA
jgi:hypothetical protein